MQGLISRFSTTLELVRALKRSGRWWLIPMVFVFAATSVLLVVVQVIEYLAPFVYSIF